MSARLVTKKVYKCVCELEDCPGKGEPWYSRGQEIPKRCNFCKRYTWNGDKRVPKNPQPDDIREYNRLRQQESRARRRKEAASGKIVNIQSDVDVHSIIRAGWDKEGVFHPVHPATVTEIRQEGEELKGGAIRGAMWTLAIEVGIGVVILVLIGVKSWLW